MFGWFFILLATVWYLTFPRYEMFIQDVLSKGLTLQAHIQCLTTHQTLCTTEQHLLALRTIYQPPAPSSTFPNYQFSHHNYTSRDGTPLQILLGHPQRSPDRPELPILLEFHLGGHIFGAETDLKISALLAGQGLDFMVVSPRYRLAPEFRFPTAPNDCMDALLWVKKNARALGGDPDKIFVAGTSAGGNLAAATSHTAFEFPEKYGKIRGQILFIPITDFHSSSHSFAMHWSTPIWNARFGLAARAMYLPNPQDWSNPRASPLYSDKLTGFWPTFLLVASHDPLRDEAVGYKNKLEKFMNKVKLVEHVGYHCGDLIMNEMGFGYGSEMESLKSEVYEFVSGILDRLAVERYEQWKEKEREKEKERDEVNKGKIERLEEEEEEFIMKKYV